VHALETRVVALEATNNAAKRSIHPGVLWRKGSLGTQSPQGSRFVEVIMTVVATLKQHHRKVLDSVTAVCEAVPQGEVPPLLIPTAADLENLMYPAA
jgi:transposase